MSPTRALLLWSALAAAAGAAACQTVKPGGSLASANAPGAPKTADLAKALGYLDARANGWIDKKWGFVTGGTCGVSCHTTVPYTLARGTFRDGAPEAPEKIRAFVANRVEHWDTIEPVYDFAKEASMMTEGALNGVVLGMAELLQGKTELSATAARAAAITAAVQMADGGWSWMQEYLAPFEDAGARYWGSAFVARALAKLPNGPGGAPLEGRAHALERAAAFLNDNFDQQGLHAQMMGALAGATKDSLLDAVKRQIVIRKLLAAQRCDGGWVLSSLGVWRTKAGVLNDPAKYTSDGYATSLALLVLAENGLSPQTRALGSAKTWLDNNQAADGSWPLVSLNDPDSAFNNAIITDAATSYSLLALDAVRLRAAVAPSLTYFIGADAGGVPARFHYNGAKSACAAGGGRLPKLAELTQIAAENMLKCQVTSGWAWTSEKGSNVLSKAVFDFEAASTGKATASSALLTSKGNVVCVKGP